MISVPMPSPGSRNREWVATVDLLAVLMVTLAAHIAGFPRPTQARLWMGRDETIAVEQHPKGQRIGQGVGDGNVEHRAGPPGDPAPQQPQGRGPTNQIEPAAI